MIDKQNFLEKSKLKDIMYMLFSYFPISRKKHAMVLCDFLDILNAQKEALMLTRQDVLLLAKKIMQFHGKELVNEKNTESTANLHSNEKVEKKLDNNMNMYS